MYSKEVMEHFLNPHNMGEIKNPDGVGTVGNPRCGDVMKVYIKVEKGKDGKERIKDIKVKTYGCLPAKEKVVLSSGRWKAIELIEKGDSIVNSKGKETLVAKTFVREHKGTILKIVPFVSPYNSFSVTPEHPVLSIKRKWLKKARKKSSKCNLLMVNKKELLSMKPKYIEAKKLEIGDYLVFSYSTKVKDNPLFTKDLMRLIGFYLSEGYITANGSIVAFALNKKEKDNINEIKFLIRKIVDKTAKERIRGNVIEVYVCSRKLAKLLYSIAGKFAKNKKLSKEFMLLPPEKQMETVSTYLLGDGDSYKRRAKDSPTFRLATASEELAIQMQEILARNGIFAAIKISKRAPHKIEGRDVTGSELFIITYKQERKHFFVHKREKSFLVPIRRIERQPFDDIVYNFHVESKPNSYLVRGFAVHNCVAAIATSSMITDLAMGKTLEEAMKISNKDIAHALKGLPPIKMHCSVLAADALHKAIEDYLKKSKTAKK